MDINRIFFKYLFYLTIKLRREWFISHLRDFDSTAYLSSEEIKQFQLKRLNEILSVAGNYIPHYKGRVPVSIETLDDLECLPLLDKPELRDDPDRFIYKRNKFQRVKVSGGSTGAPVVIIKDNEGMAREMAGTWRGYSWAGVHIGDRQVRFWGVPRNNKEKWRARLIDFICNRLRVTAFDYNEDSFRSSIKTIKKFDPDYLYGYVSIISDFARYIVKNNLKGSFSVKSVITTSEVLTDIDRKLIEEAFGARVYNEYGCGEVGTIAHECEHGAMHISSENVILEVLEGDRPAEPGCPGELVVTDLTNLSMPLIRYRLKDFGILNNKECPCGRTLPILEKVYGRQYDSLENKQGQKFHGEFFLYMVEDARKVGMVVSGIQFVQKANYDIVVKVVARDDVVVEFSEYVIGRIHKEFDEEVTVDVVSVPAIEREASGKLRVVKRDD